MICTETCTLLGGMGTSVFHLAWWGRTSGTDAIPPVLSSPEQDFGGDKGHLALTSSGLKYEEAIVLM